MDDVFLRVGQMTENTLSNKEENLHSTNGVGNGETTIFLPSSKSRSIIVQQMKALFMKRMHYAKRHPFLLVIQLILPLLAVLLYLFIDVAPGMNRNVNELTLDLKAMFVDKKCGIYYMESNTFETKRLAAKYKYTLEKESVNVKEIVADDPQEYLIKIGKDSVDSYTREYLIGGSLANEDNGHLSVKAWYNGIHYDLEPISLNLMTSSVLKYATENDNSNIQVTIHPLTDKRTRYNYPPRKGFGPEKMFNIIFLPLGLTFLSSSFVLFPIHERVTKAKLLQRMCGVSAVIYWLMHLAWDYLIYVISSAFFLIPFLVYYELYGYLASQAVGAIFLCLLLYGFSSITMSYLMSFISKKPSTGFAISTIFNAITGIVISIAMSTVALLQLPSLKVEISLWFMRLFPSFTITWAINNIHVLNLANSECSSYSREELLIKCFIPMNDECCTDDVKKGRDYQPLTYLTWDNKGAGKECLFLFITFTLWSLIIILIENFLPNMYYIFQNKCQFKKRQQSIGRLVELQTLNMNEDSDVSNERRRIQEIYNQNALSEDAIVAMSLTKVFRNLCAVNKLTFGVHKKECFGLLGINGAGKTTTFQMLAGDLFPTNGNAYIGTIDIKNKLQEFQTSVGYCPQFDALVDRLTGREMLELFANLRGIPQDCVKGNVNKMISMCDLEANADKQTRTYSGGTKRKLSLAIALIGAPPIVLLDEPTAGVDPASRRKIWKALSTMKQMLGVSFILTSHSMDECESLCNRIAIMVNGEFRCMGAMQSLKTKFGQGYTIIAKLQQADSFDINKVLEVKSYIESRFPSASLKVEHQGALHYHVKDTSMKWSTMFSIMQETKNKFQLEDYVLSGTTLEQIFLAFARAQRGLV